MVFLLIFVYKITTNPSVVKCTKPNKKMYKITKSGFVRSFTFLTPFPCPLQKKTIQYIEREKHISSLVFGKAGCPLFAEPRHPAMPATAATLLRRSAKPYLSVRQPVNSAGFPSFPALFLQPPAARDVLRPAASFRRAKVSAMHIDAHQPDRPTIKNEVCKFPCPKQRTCRLFCDNKLPPVIFTAESCAARFRTGRNPSA